MDGKMWHIHTTEYELVLEGMMYWYVLYSVDTL